MSSYVRTRVCDTCGKVEEVRADNKSTTCLSCASRKRGAKGLKTIKARARKTMCARCGKIYTGNNTTYCSKACMDADRDSRRLKLTCDHCGAKFERPPSIRGEGTNAAGRFCSRRCYESHMCRTEKVSGRGSRWHKIRQEVLSDFPFCAICGTTKDLQVHHIIPWRISFDNRHINLIPLCRKHHRIVESITQNVEATGFGEYHLLALNSILRERQFATRALVRSLIDAR